MVWKIQELFLQRLKFLSWKYGKLYVLEKHSEYLKKANIYDKPER